ncbi:hypothetical protein [Streptomyces spirodelae]|uniref:Type IV secretion system protein n=1 Tax=Streptomyces spirodelae TaxID=2812904 RepID=A0ABS3X498_9ACTN|nr:hypothetical protein [Streptomyces spirodelae]MBO8189891.1 hypothetical protein [Streptomyces spirodelae]
MIKFLGRLFALLACLLLTTTLAAPSAYAAKPPDPIPKDIASGVPGIDKKTGEYCDLTDPDPKKRASCRPPEPGEMEGTAPEGEVSHDGKKIHAYEMKKLKKWREQNKGKYKFKERNAAFTKCLKTQAKMTFSDCARDVNGKYPPPATTPDEWAANKVKGLAKDAVGKVAETIGHGVMWFLEQFADSFDEMSRIKLADTGLTPVLSLTTGLSLLVATFLLLVQFGKVAISRRGEPLATAISGLAKWAAILSVYLFATQVALNWVDTLSTALINESMGDGGTDAGDARKAMKKQLGTMFAGLVAGAGPKSASLITPGGVAATTVAVVIVLGLLAILAIGALWLEMLLRQAGIMILVVMMPIVLAGQMADATREWWPKARNALIALILMKPMIVLTFAIGFEAMATGQGVMNVLVGLLMFTIAAFSWPILAKFMVINSVGDGNSVMSGMISTAGSSVSSMIGGYSPALSGAGTVGGGGYTKALEGDSANATQGSKAGKGFWKSGGGAMAGASGLGLGVQALAAGKDMVESAGANTAAHAGLGQGSQGGRHVVMPPRGGGSQTPEADPPVPAQRPAAPGPSSPEAGPPPQPPLVQPPRPTPPDQER